MTQINGGLLNNVKLDPNNDRLSRQELWDSAKHENNKNKNMNNHILAKIIAGVDVTEVYSRPRIAAACQEAGLVGGSSFDLRTGWDLSNPHQQRMAIQKIMAESPRLLVGSPPCTLFSILQNLNLAVQDEKWRHEFYELRRKAEAHLKFCCKLYKLQRVL